MELGQIMFDKGRKCKIAAFNRDKTSRIWLVEIEYVGDDGNLLHPNAFAWVSPNRLKKSLAQSEI